MKRKSLKKLTAIFAAIMLALQAASAAVFALESGNYIEYTVVAGDTLSHIAKKYGVTVDEIARANGIENVNLISTGTVLKIPAKGGATETVTEAAPSQAVQTAPQAVEPTGASSGASVVTAGLKEPQGPAKIAAAMPTSTTPVAISGNTAESEPDDGDFRSMLTSFDTKVSISFANASMLDVLTAFAQSLGYNIIYKGDANQKVTLSMKDVTIGEALEYVLKLNDLSYIVKGNTIIVGNKDDITSTFVEEAKITEFTLTYVPADTVIGQINTFNIPVTATLSGGSQYRFLAQGLPEDLARVRSLINMVDRRENAVDGGMKPASIFYAIDLTYVTAAEFQRILSAASLPSGVILSSRPKTLYVFAMPDEYSSIKAIKNVVDIASPGSAGENGERIVEKALKYVTVDLIESQITSNADVRIIKVSTNNTKMWLRGNPQGIADAEKIISLLDKPENAAKDEAQLVEKFTPVTTQYINAAMLRETVSRLSIDAITVVYDTNPYTLYVYATDENLEKIYDLIKIIDTQENAGAKADDVLASFKPVSCQYISAEQLNSVLHSMSLPTGLIFEGNPYTLYIYATDTDFAQILELLKIVDIKENEDAELASGLKSITCRYITAEQLNTMLRGMSLPTGLYFDYNPYVLYLNVNDAQYREIAEVAAYVDTLENSRAGKFDIYHVDLYYINVDKAVEFIGQLGLGLDIVRLRSSQKRLWLMGEYTEYLKAKAAITSIDVPNASLTSSFETFELANITAGEAKKLIDNASLTGVLTYVPYGNENGNRIVIYYPNDAKNDIRLLVRKIDTDEFQSAYTKLLEKLDKNIYLSFGEDESKPWTWKKVIDRINLLSSLSGVDSTKFEVYEQLVQDENDSSKLYVVVYLKNVTLKQYNDVLEVKNQLGAPVSDKDKDKDNNDNNNEGESGATSTSASASASAHGPFIYDPEEIQSILFGIGD